MAGVMRTLLSRSRSRAFFPILARFDDLERRLDVLAAQLDRLGSEQAEFRRIMADLHVATVRQEGRIAALEERAVAADPVLEERRLHEIGRTLS